MSEVIILSAGLCERVVLCSFAEVYLQNPYNNFAFLRVKLLYEFCFLFIKVINQNIL